MRRAQGSRVLHPKPLSPERAKTSEASKAPQLLECQEDLRLQVAAELGEEVPAPPRNRSQGAFGCSGRGLWM